MRQRRPFNALAQLATARRQRRCLGLSASLDAMCRDGTLQFFDIESHELALFSRDRTHQCVEE